MRCSKCGAAGKRAESGACELPAMWEHESPMEQCRAISVGGRRRSTCDMASAVCGECIAALLAALEGELRRFCWGAS